MKKLFEELPGWVRWGVIPVLALLVFGSVIMKIIGVLVFLLFKVLLFVAVVAAVILAARKFSKRA
ncbi:DUF5326 family protein [Wenjunlia tyrosinilytica]|uniref:DUF5326 family protein n=1 Tax=Wenjunlia tyrosinilytica TaxID=1544741 RepID=A0A917ZLC9_9ACTN|nr:DUF5326 family protein [Wenjunlia tyrosinilytica]GGO86349.1 hypothetical protein GCM10012280_22250 [Wenjunlia tyrosinilytica]